jgi:hypothetical protein
MFVLDAAGRMVWWNLPDWGVIPSVHLDGGSLLYVQSSHDEMPLARVRRMRFDGTIVEDLPIAWAHHDVLPVPGADFAVIVGEPREIDGETIVGDSIVEVGTDGTQRTVWSAFDTFPVDISALSATTAYPEGTDWTHANGLAYDPAEDAYYLSLFYLRCVVKIDRASGRTLWVLGGDHATITPSEDFGPQHAPEWTGDGLEFFDNAYGRAGGSRLVRYAVDGSEANLVWQWSHPESLFVVVLGDVDALPEGRHLSSWGPQRRIVATNAEDAIDWQVELGGEIFLAQVEAEGSLY